ncbi:MAG: OOP family OmpA-OmpF porin [Yoonia sp.]|jgi:OOP family OmpA-OmpF porin
MIRWGLAFCCAAWATDATGQNLSFPSNATVTREVTRALDSYAMPIGPWSDGVLPQQTVEGQFTQQAWTIAATGLTTLQLIRPLRDQLRNDGFDVVYECRDQDCGGFDFRFQTDVLPPPEMQVNLVDFRYLAARKAEGSELISVLASRSARAGFVQITRVGPTTTVVATANAAPLGELDEIVPTGDLGANLAQTGRAVLSGLEFQTGSSKLGAGPFDTLQALADFLAAQPDMQVALVGHTDATGALDGNIALSKRRARSVLERLASNYGVSRSQLDAQGMGYLAPIASNLTQDGRTTNRRVEVIITTTN